MSKARRELGPAPFWIWANSKGAGSRAEERRTIIDLQNSMEDKRLFGSLVGHGHGRVNFGKLPEFVSNLEFTREAEDCPWTIQGALFVVSDRLRKILEEHAPGNCQFAPLKLRNNGSPSNLTYWILYVDSIDCADPERTKHLAEPVVIEERVPQTTQVFRVWYPVENFSDAGLFVRDSLRRVLKREKVTGCFFYEPPVPGMGRPPRES